jgi:protein-S-isoprenylcysteine O-methyltransferase Ste14
VLLLAIVLVGAIGLYYRIRTHTGEKLDRRQEGLFILIGLRVVAGMVFTAVVLYLADPQRMRWSSLVLPLWLRWAGVVVGALGSLLFLWTFHTLGPNLTDTVVTRAKHTLVTVGPYRWVRHPFYTARPPFYWRPFS